MLHNVCYILGTDGVKVYQIINIFSSSSKSKILKKAKNWILWQINFVPRNKRAVSRLKHQLFNYLIAVFFWQPNETQEIFYVDSKQNFRM